MFLILSDETAQNKTFIHLFCHQIHQMENIVTNRLYLVPFSLERVEAAIIGTDKLADILGVKIAPDWPDEQLRENLPGIADILRNYPLQNEWGWGFLVIHKAENILIGHIMLKIPFDMSSEIGYQIVPSYQRQGYASEATTAVIDWAFCQPNVQTITAGCDADNIASRRVLEKIGMQHIETRNKGLIWKLNKS